MRKVTFGKYIPKNKYYVYSYRKITKKYCNIISKLDRNDL